MENIYYKKKGFHKWDRLRYKRLQRHKIDMWRNSYAVRFLFPDLLS